jgi:hypothetical protein
MMKNTTINRTARTRRADQGVPAGGFWPGAKDKPFVLVTNARNSSWDVAGRDVNPVM